MGKRQAAEALAKELGIQLLVVKLSRALVSDTNFDQLLRVALREGWLLSAIVYLEGADELRRDGKELRHQTLLD